MTFKTIYTYTKVGYDSPVYTKTDMLANKSIFVCPIVMLDLLIISLYAYISNNILQYGYLMFNIASYRIHLLFYPKHN